MGTNFSDVALESGIDIGIVVSPEQIGGRPTSLTYVMFLDYSKDSVFSVKSMSPGVGAVRLLEFTLVADIEPGRVLMVCSQLADRINYLEGTRGEAETAALLLRKLSKCS